MRHNLDDTLEKCLKLLADGASIEDCLKKYPAKAEELKGLLKMARLSRKSLQYSIPGDTRDRVRGRVMAHWDQEFRHSAQRRSILSLVPRWVYVAACSILFLLVSGAGISRAAIAATPGEFLYPVKRSTEEVRLAFAFSERAKAEVYLGLAEHRISEILKLAGKGRVENITELTQDVTEHLLDSEQYATVSRKNPEPFIDKLESSALGQLERLEQVRPRTAPGEREVVDTALKHSGEAYGKAIEAFTGNLPLSSTEERGSLRLFISEPTFEQADSTLVLIDSIEVYQPGLDSEWTMLRDEPISVNGTGLQGVIAEKAIGAGAYTKLRINIANVTLTVGGETIEAHLPDQQLIIVRPFKVTDGETTELVLDIDWKKSVVVSEEGRHVVSPGTLLISPPDSQETGPPDDVKAEKADDKGSQPSDDVKAGKAGTANNKQRGNKNKK